MFFLECRVRIVLTRETLWRIIAVVYILADALF